MTASDHSNLPQNHAAGDAPLGRATPYPTAYDPGQLYAIPRAENRQTLGLTSGALPFHGDDVWNAYEVSWLGSGGKPEARAAQLRFPCASPTIVESKSLKLYLNSLNQHRFDSPEHARSQIETDLSRAAGAPVPVRFFTTTELEARAFADGRAKTGQSRCLDALNVTVTHYNRAPQLLRRASTAKDEAHATSIAGTLYTDLFKSTCPVTGQPDWASVFVEYEGPEIDAAGLFAYLISYRNEQDFHEHCVEQIFTDLNERCAPERLTVYACFLRRGGLDINPFRSNFQASPEFLRAARQ